MQSSRAEERKDLFVIFSMRWQCGRGGVVGGCVRSSGYTWIHLLHRFDQSVLKDFNSLPGNDLERKSRAVCKINNYRQKQNKTKTNKTKEVWG